MKYKRLSQEETENIKVGEKFNFGNGDVREVVGFSETSYLVNGKNEILIDSVGEGGKKSFCRSVFTKATKESESEDIVKCMGCGELMDKEDSLDGIIISRNWEENNHRSPPRTYCKDKPCFVHDQMAHEG